MKKIILLSFCLCALLTTSMAQSYQGRNMDFLTDEKYFKVELDYSLVSNNLAFKTDEEIQEWESGQSLKELTDECIKCLNEKLEERGCHLRASNIKPAKYRVIISVTRLTRGGNTNADIYFKPVDSDNTLYITSLYGDGGRVGTVVNLMGDGIRSLAVKLGRFIDSKTHAPARK